jgi:hypothetical protein
VSCIVGTDFARSSDTLGLSRKALANEVFRPGEKLRN